MTRQRNRPIANPALEAHLALTGRTYQAIAAAINKVSVEATYPITCTAASLSKWVSGTVPQPASREIVVEALSRLLDRPDLTVPDLGWPQAAQRQPDPWRGDPVHWITILGREEMLDRRTALTTGLYSLAAAALPSPDRRPVDDVLSRAQSTRLTTADTAFRPDRVLARSGSERRGGTSDLDRIRAATQAFADLDDQFGGGHARPAVAAYLASAVAPLLRGTTGRARPAMFTAAAELAYLLGWMAADDMRHGLAQAWYVQAVRLSEEAGDPTMRSTALRSLAVQAINLGHNNHSHALAEAAAEGLRLRSPLRKRAWITGMRAEALAATGYQQATARRLLADAETDLERADSLPEADWTGNYRRESYEHQTGLTLTQLGDHKGAEQHYAASIASRRPAERRTKALITTRLALAQLHQRRPDEAAHTILELLPDLPVLMSASLDLRVAQIRRAWTPYRPNPTVEQADRALTGL